MEHRWVERRARGKRRRETADATMFDGMQQREFRRG
jgi:hypothetical protein